MRLQSWLARGAVSQAGLAPPKSSKAAALAVAPGTVAARAVGDGARLVAREETAIFASLESWEQIAAIRQGDKLVAAGSPCSVEGYTMVPVHPRGAVDMTSFLVQDTPTFTTRPSASLGEVGTEDDDAVVSGSAAELDRLRAIRGKVYREKYRGPCRRRSSRFACACALLTEPIVFAATATQHLILSVLAVLGAIFSALLRPQFWLGALSTLALVARLTWHHCAVSPSGTMAPQLPGHPAGPVRFTCENNHQWAQDLRDSVWTAGAYVAENRERVFQITDDMARVRDALLSSWLWPFLGWCPFRDEADAVSRCAQREELEQIRSAGECAALRRAFHQGQRHFHPDHLRFKHPDCSDKILEACSVALNAAMEARRHTLNCPAR